MSTAVEIAPPSLPITHPFAESSSSLTCNPYFHNDIEVQETVQKAQQSLQQFPNDIAMSERLAVMILFSKGFSHPSAKHSMQGRLDYLKCALLKLKLNLMNHTHTDVYIWALNTTEHPIHIPSWFTKEAFPRMHILAIPTNVWKIPCGLLPDKDWALRKLFDVDYYLMGRWRLTFSLDFAKAMGYEYHLQFDDDAMLNDAITTNVIKQLQDMNALAGVFSDFIYEVPQATVGLPELTRFWIKLHNYSPKGPIFSQCDPHDIKGLSSEGWYRGYHPGYFFLLKISFWYSDEIQSFLHTVLRSGRDVEGRWQEQAVMNMILQVFVPNEQKWILKSADIGHDRHKRANFENWCVKTGIMNTVAAP